MLPVVSSQLVHNEVASHELNAMPDGEDLRKLNDDELEERYGYAKVGLVEHSEIMARSPRI